MCDYTPLSTTPFRSRGLLKQRTTEIKVRKHQGGTHFFLENETRESRDCYQALVYLTQKLI